MSNKLKKYRYKKENMEVFKLVRPMTPTISLRDKIILYNKSRDIYSDNMPMTPELALMFAHSNKIYVKAVITDDDEFYIHDQLPDQGW